MKTVFTSLVIFLFLNVRAQTQNKAGTLDRSFGDTGIVLTKTNGVTNKIALQSDGKIIDAGGGTFNNQVFLIMRYNTDGRIDSGFGNDGITGNQDLSQVFGLAIQEDDAIVALGHTAADIKLARYKKEGGLDSSFGINGKVITNVGQNDIPVDVVIQHDGKIIAGGYIINQPNQARQGFLIRYLPDGNLDESFGKKGIVILGKVDGDKSFAGVYAIALQPNGQILMSAVFNGGVVYRFNANGSIDASFGNKGKATFQQSDNMVKSFIANGLVVQQDGKIVGGGSSLKKQFSTDFTYMATARLNADGSIDSSFGKEGIQHVLFDKDPSDGKNILLQRDGKLIITGRTYDENQTYSHLGLARFTSNGAIDPTFGSNGQTITEVSGYAVSNSSLLQKDGKILFGGDTFIGDFTGENYFVLGRYNNDGSNKQIIVTKIKRWLQHHNGFTWDANSSVSNYTVQRSYDGIHWKAVSGEQQAVSNASVNYYNDPMPLSGNNYYRLQTTSTNGAVNYSNVIVVTANDDAIKISPNPAKNNLQIQGLTASTKTKITVVDFSGNIKLQAVANNTSFNLNIATLTPGNYLLKIETDDGLITKKFLKQ